MSLELACGFWELLSSCLPCSRSGAAVFGIFSSAQNLDLEPVLKKAA